MIISESPLLFPLVTPSTSTPSTTIPEKEWSSWTEWSDCKQGEQTRERTCSGSECYWNPTVFGYRNRTNRLQVTDLEQRDCNRNGEDLFTTSSTSTTTSTTTITTISTASTFATWKICDNLDEGARIFRILCPKKLATEDFKEKENFECIKMGRFPDPKNCEKFFLCEENSNNQFQRYSFDCAPGLLFNKKKGLCDFRNNVQCE